MRNDLATLYDKPEPFVTVAVCVDPATEDAAHRFELQRRAIERRLAEQGADDRTVASITAALDDHTAGGTHWLVAAGGELQLAVDVPEVTVSDDVTVSPLPRLLPVLMAESWSFPYLLVTADRAGADIAVYRTGRGVAGTASVETAEWPLHKTGIGGWAAKRFDNTVGESWERSARSVADAVARAAAEVEAVAVVLTGDVRAVHLVRDHLPAELQDRVDVIEGGGRREGSSDDELAADALRTAMQHWVAGIERRLAEYAELLGTGDRAVAGVSPTVQALRQAAVAELIVTDDAVLDRPAYYGPAFTDVALDRRELVDLGIEPVHEDAVGEVLVRAALGTGATVRAVPGGHPLAPREGVGAVLRFAT